MKGLTVKLNPKWVEQGLKVFYQLKYVKSDLDFSELPEIVDNIYWLKSWHEQTSDQDSILIALDQLINISDSLQKYFRDEFIETVDRNSIEVYLEDKPLGDLNWKVTWEVINSKSKTSDYYLWLLGLSKTISFLEKHNRYTMYSVANLIKNISFEQYKNKQIKSFLQQYFLDEFESLFARIHLNHLLGIFTYEESKSTQSTKPILKLKTAQIALKHVYDGVPITRKNGNDIAKQYGHNSGETLFQKFSHYSSTANRKGRPTPFTPRKLKNKIELFESVILLLPPEKRSWPEDELKILKTMFDNDY